MQPRIQLNTAGYGKMSRKFNLSSVLRNSNVTQYTTTAFHARSVALLHSQNEVHTQKPWQQCQGFLLCAFHILTFLYVRLLSQLGMCEKNRYNWNATNR